MRKHLGAALGVALLATGAFGQSAAPPKSFEQRLVEILRSRGLLDEAAERELLDLAASMRAADAAKTSDLDREIRTINAALTQEGKTTTDSGPTLSFKKGFVLETADKDFTMKIGGWIQPRATFTDLDDDTNPAGGDDTLSLAVNRARLGVEGNAYGKNVTYKAQLELAGAGSSLRDGWVNYAWGPEVQFKAGQYKVPFSRQQLNSASKQQFVDRAFTNTVFVPGREPGGMLHGQLGGGQFEWAFGGFNGDGQNGNTNDDNGIRWAGRLVFNPMGPLPSPNTESDLDRTGEPRLSLGANAMRNPDRLPVNRDIESFGLDAQLVCGNGFSFQVEGFMQRAEPEGSGPDQDDLGGYMQAGYCFASGWEAAVRYAAVAFDSDVLAAGGLREQREYQFAVNRFIRKHDLKISADLTRRYLDNLSARDALDDIVRLQGVLAF